MVAIVRRKLTKNPQLEAGKELLGLIYRLTDMNESTFVSAFEKWKRKWHDFLKEKTINEITGRTIYTHQRLRSAMVSISTYLPFLFTYEKVKGMPNTNNMIEGTFTDMKKALRNHPGMIKENRKRMINGFFLAYAKLHNKIRRQPLRLSPKLHYAYWMALFLAELLPSRAPLRFKPQCKITKCR